MPAQPNDAFNGFLVLLARLWRAKWFVIGFAALFAIVTYANLKFLTDETFQSEAILYLSPDIQAPTVKTLITSAELLDVVRTRYRQQFPHATGVTYLDRFAKRFHVSQEINEDNSLRKVYSAAVVLTADANSPKEAQALAGIWLDEIVARCGGLSGVDSLFQAEKARNLMESLKNQEKDVVVQRTALQYQVAELDSRLQGLLRILSPVDQSTLHREREFTAYIRGMQPRAQQVSVSVPSAVAPTEPGLIEQQIKLHTDLAKARTRLDFLRKNAAKTDAPPGATLSGPKPEDLEADIAVMVAEEKSMQDQISELRDDITSLTLALQKGKSNLAGAEADLATIRLQEDFVGSAIADNATDGYLSTQQLTLKSGDPARMDFSVVSRPSLPDRKIAPQRMVSAILAGIIGGILACFVIAFVHLVERLPKLSNSRGR